MAPQQLLVEVQDIYDHVRACRSTTILMYRNIARLHVTVHQVWITDGS
jgi:hypothetical protein